MIRTQLIIDSRQLSDLRDQWDELLESSATGTVFQSPAWVDAWWHRFGDNKQLLAVAILDSELLVGLALFMSLHGVRFGIGIRSLHFIGETGSGLCPDHLDVLARPGFENTVHEAVVSWLFESAAEWDQICLSSISATSSFFGRLCQEVERKNYRSNCGTAYVAPFLELPSRVHKNWKDKYRKLCKNFKVSFECLSDERDVEQCLTITRSLVRDSARRNNRPSSWDDDPYYRFHRDVSHGLAKRKEFQVALLFCDDVPVAVLYGYVFKNKYLMYSTGVNAAYGTFSIGQIIVGKYLEYLTENGIEEFDFLRGTEEYKFRWTDTLRHNQFVHVYGSGFVGRYLYTADRLICLLRGIRKRLRRFSFSKEVQS